MTLAGEVGLSCAEHANNIHCPASVESWFRTFIHSAYHLMIFIGYVFSVRPRKAMLEAM